MPPLSRVLLLDNRDSFTYNLVDYLRRLGAQVVVYRNDVPPHGIPFEDFQLLVISPGPSHPRQAGTLMQWLAVSEGRIPMLGICLGHQAIVEHFGGKVAPVTPCHGKTERVVHDGASLFSQLPPTLEVARYHSLAAVEVPQVLQVSARAADGTVMAVRHQYLPIEGVQFHPESVLSMHEQVGLRLLKNVLDGRMANLSGNYRKHMLRLQNPEPLAKDDLGSMLQGLGAEGVAHDHQLVLLAALSVRLMHPEALVTLAQVLLAQNTLADGWPELPDSAVDVCGTGGSGLPRLNTSTLTALLLAAAGVPVLKHGNRAAAGRFGSFDLLEALGMAPAQPLPSLQAAWHATRLAFLYAPQAYPLLGALRHARARLAVPSVFNILGPLINPLQPRRQLIGTSYAQYQKLLLHAAVGLGRTHVAVVRGDDGLDEVTLMGPTRAMTYTEGHYAEEVITPESFGLKPLPATEVLVPDPQQNVALAQEMLAGQPRTAHHQLVLANAAYAYARLHVEMPLPQAYEMMHALLRQGALGQQWLAYRQALQHTAPIPVPAA